MYLVHNKFGQYERIDFYGISGDGGKQVRFRIADRIINKSNLNSNGVYTSVGTYDFGEMVNLVVSLHKETDIEIPILLQTFGQYLFSRFVSIYAYFFNNKNNSFDFLENLEDYIHAEVLKLYPDAQLPRIDISRPDPKRLVMVYHSERKLHELAVGLLKGCFSHFNENILVEQNLVKEDGSVVEFTLTKQ